MLILLIVCLNFLSECNVMASDNKFDIVAKRTADYLKENNLTKDSYIVTAIFVYSKGSLINYDVFWKKKYKEPPTSYKKTDILVRVDSISSNLKSFCLIFPYDNAKDGEIMRIDIDSFVIFPSTFISTISKDDTPLTPIIRIYNAIKAVNLKDARDESVKIESLVGIYLIYDSNMYWSDFSSGQSLKMRDYTKDKLSWLVITSPNRNFSRKAIDTLGGGSYFFLNPYTYKMMKTFYFK